jgi:hypothetical protein
MNAVTKNTVKEFGAPENSFPESLKQHVIASKTAPVLHQKTKNGPAVSTLAEEQRIFNEYLMKFTIRR